MTPPQLVEQPMITLHVTLRRIPLGRTPTGDLTEVPFEGTATSPHWDGEWTVTGVDHITRGTDGVAHIDVHTVISNGDASLRYWGVGRGGPNGIREGITFQTSSERLAWMNSIVAVGRGVVTGDQLDVEIYLLD
jgi:hypothetical protein